MTVLEILIAARKKLSKPGSWTQGHYAVDKDGALAWPSSPEACRFCARGAVMAATGLGDGAISAPEETAAVKRLCQTAPIKGCIVQSNDSSKMTHAKVLRWFDRAIAAEKKASRT